MASRVLLLSINGAAANDVKPLLERRGLSVNLQGDPNSALQRVADHQLIVLDAPDEATLSLLCRRINDQAGSTHPPILAIAHTPDVEARVRLLEAGADDVVARPIDERELEALVEALLLRSPSGSRSGMPAPALPSRPIGAPGRVVVFAAAKGGSGTTSLAVNTALILAEMAPGNVAIADLDMFHGQVSTHLDIYGRSSTAAMAREDPSNLTPEMLQEAGRQHPSGLMVFGGPYRPDESVSVTGQHLAGLVDQLRTVFGTVVIDAGSTLDMRALAVVQRADHTALILTPDIPALRLLHAALQVLSEMGSAADRSVFVVNQVYAKPMIGADQIEEHLGIKVGLEIPYDGEGFVKAVNEGQPLVESARRSAPAVAIRRLAEQLSQINGAEAEMAQPQRRGILRGILGR